MPENLSLDHLVSPWDIKLDSTYDIYTQTHKNGTLAMFKSKLALKPGKRKTKHPEQRKRNYLLVVLNSSKQVITHVSPAETRQESSQSALKKLKQRLHTVNNQQKSKQFNTLEIPEIEPAKHSPNSKCSKKTTSRQTNHSPCLLVQMRARIKRNVTKNVGNLSQIFAKKESHSPKSLERFKSNKRLVLPKIQMCTIE